MYFLIEKDISFITTNYWRMELYLNPSTCPKAGHRGDIQRHLQTELKQSHKEGNKIPRLGSSISLQ